jgi:cytochrome c553
MMVIIRTRQALCVTLLCVAAAAAVQAQARGDNGPPGVNLCQACHGNNGEGRSELASPRLAGQFAEYLDKQLHDFSHKTRISPPMQYVTDSMSDAQVMRLATFFATRKASPTASRKEETPAGRKQGERGRILARVGDESLGVQACGNCHGPDGVGVQNAAPVLAGQRSEYLMRALKDWKTSLRMNDSGRVMAEVASRLGDADIAAVAQYFSGLSAPMREGEYP